MLRALPILLALALASTVASAASLSDLEPGGTVQVDAAIDGETLRLADGRELRLAAIVVPRPALPRAGVTASADPAAQALADAARAALQELAGGRDAVLYYEARRSDRYGRMVAQIEVASGPWLQAELLRRGLARVQTTDDTAAEAPLMLRAEAEARAARRGLWAQRAFRVRRPDELGDAIDSFQIVEGHVAGVRRTASQTWLDFAGPRGRALKITIPSAARKRFRAGGLDLASLTDAELRVRGWLRWQDGPIIEIDHPAAIEILDR